MDWPVIVVETMVMAIVRCPLWCSLKRHGVELMEVPDERLGGACSPSAELEQVMQGGFDDSVVPHIHGLFEEAAVDPIVAPEVVLQVRRDVQGPAEGPEVLFPADVILNKSPSGTDADQLIEQSDEGFE
jgi:hypothetical protein